MEHWPVLYTNLLVTGKLDQHLVEIDESCEKQMTSVRVWPRRSKPLIR